MACDGSDIRRDDRAPVPVKILIAGGSGAGKTTLMGALTGIRPVLIEESVAMNFGRITISGDLAIYLFGMPGHKRFWSMWDDLSRGTLGAVVLADVRRLADCFPAIDYFEDRSTPFVVALNSFPGTPRRVVDEVRKTLRLDPNVPIVTCDARERGSCRDTLVTLVGHAITLAGTGARAPTPSGSAV
ncbi:MAG TPA: ATP/GTP-binding protein [Streptosporangiaceae bacterium]|nr:ATP/GTP-binding protein [Streptosporangiaceae bacterium]